MICFLLDRHLDDVNNVAFKKTEKNNNCIIITLNYIGLTQKCNIIKMIKVKFKIILND